MENPIEPQNSPQNGGDTQGKRTEKGQFVPGVSGNPDKIITSEKQPSGLAKSNGKKKKKAEREAIREILSAVYKLSPEAEADLKKSFPEKLVKKANAYEIGVMKIVQKMVKQNDVNAFTALSNQIFGLPKQPMEHSGPDGKELQIATRRVIIENPHARTSDSKS